MKPNGYRPCLDFLQTQLAIALVKATFEKKLAEAFSLLKVTAPRFLIRGTGLQDDLAGTQAPVSFSTKFARVEMVHSLAKWKRHMLGKHGFVPGTGLYTEMDAVRKDEDVSDINSVHVDQWDWEQVITREQRTPGFLKQAVQKIYEAMQETEAVMAKGFPELRPQLPKSICFVAAQELEDAYPALSPMEREDKTAREHRALFLMGIGRPLKSGKPHDLRAADYDDWTLNGDIIVWDPVRRRSLELSSMGIRVDAPTLMEQLKRMGQEEKAALPFHRGIMEGSAPLTIGGGIGKSRLAMLLLRKAHIGEVQSSAWPKSMERECEAKGITLL